MNEIQFSETDLLISYTQSGKNVKKAYIFVEKTEKSQNFINYLIFMKLT